MLIAGPGMVASPINIETYELRTGDALRRLRELPDGSVQTICTSPPYYSLRAYLTSPQVWDDDPACAHEWNSVIPGDARGGSGPNAKAKRKVDDKSSYGRNATRGRFCTKCAAWEGELGLEPTPALFVQHLVQIFQEVNRVLRSDGTLFLNIADTFYSGPLKGIKDPWNLKKKDLCGVPQRLVLALQEAGWYWRSDGVWSKAGGNCPRCHFRIEKGSTKPECLAPDTPIFLKEDDLVIRRPLSYVADNADRLTELKILTPDGWRTIRNVWRTKKIPVSADAGYVTSFTASGDHRFPVSHDRRAQTINNIPLSQIRDKGYNDYLLFADISEFVGHGIESIDLVMLICAQSNPFGVRANLKSALLLEGATGAGLSDRYGYKLKKYDTANGYWAYGGPLIHSITAGRVPLDVVVGEQIDVTELTLTSERKSEQVVPKIELTADIGRLVGFYAAEGGFKSLDKYPNHHQGKFTFNADEHDYISFVEQTLRALGTDPTVYPAGSATEVRLSSSPLRHFFQHLVPGDCKSKSLNLDVVLNTPKAFREGLLRGYFEGDGHKHSVTSASRDLIDAFAVVAATLGLMPSKYASSVCDKRSGRTRVSYAMKLTKRDRGGGMRRSDGLRQIRLRNKVVGQAPIEMIDVEVDGGVFVVDNGLVTHNSVKDRFTRSHEYLFLLTKSPKYYFDVEAVKSEHTTSCRRDVFHISSQNFRGAHYATMPPALAEVAILGGTSEHGACAKCNAPYKRLTKKGKTDKKKQQEMGANADGSYHGENLKDYEAAGAEKASDLKRRILEGAKKIETVGWEQTCKCVDPGKPVPCLVMDPFSGAATTGAVALKNGRCYLGLELLESNNTEIAKPRLDSVLEGMKPFEEIDYLPVESGIYHGRAEILLHRVQPGSVRLILTDPPYNVSRENNYHTMGREGINFDWDGDFDQETWVRLADKALMVGGSIVIWNDWKVVGLIAHLLLDMGYDVKRNLTWVKSNPWAPNPESNPAQRTEVGLWAVKRVKKTTKWVHNLRNHRSYEDLVFHYGVPKGSKKKEALGRFRHETKKPNAMFREIIQIFSNPGDLVLDPFAGGGTTSFAAAAEDRRCISFELDDKWFKEATLHAAEGKSAKPLKFPITPAEKAKAARKVFLAECKKLNVSPVPPFEELEGPVPVEHYEVDTFVSSSSEDYKHVVRLKRGK